MMDGWMEWMDAVDGWMNDTDLLTWMRVEKLMR